MLVGACVTALFVLSEAPWLLVALPAAIVGLFIIFDLLRDDVYLTSEHQHGLGAWHARYLTSARRLIGKPPILLVPESQVSSDEKKFVKRAAKLSGEVSSALRQSPIPPDQKALLLQQAGEAPANIAGALWRLARLRRIRKSADTKTKQGRATVDDIKSLEDDLLAEMAHSLDVLAAVPVSLVKVELARTDRSTERLLENLSESNQKLQDMTAAYREMNGNA